MIVGQKQLCMCRGTEEDRKKTFGHFHSGYAPNVKQELIFAVEKFLSSLLYFVTFVITDLPYSDS